MKLGGGSLVLSGTNTYGGLTAVNAGTLFVTSTSSLPNYLSSGYVSVNNAGSGLVLQSGSNAGEFQPSDIASTLGNTTFAPSTTFGIQVNSGDSASYGGNIPDATGGGLAFVKLGAGADPQRLQPL